VKNNVLLYVIQGSHTSWKVLEFFGKFPGPGKSWIMTFVLESPANLLARSSKILEFVRQ